MSFGTIILDPPEGISNRSALNITPWLRQEGPDWGDAAIEAVMSSRTYGEVPVDFTVPNREIQMPLIFTKTIGGTTVPAARAKIQAKIALFQREGGVIKRITPNGGSVYADVVDATTMGFSSQAGWEASRGVDIDPAVSLRCLPDFYQGERTLGDHVETTNPELIFTETAIKGDYPARCRIVVDDDSAHDQRGLLYGFRSRNYSSDNKAALKYEAEALEPVGAATKVATSRASGGTAVRVSPLFPSWTSVLATRKGGTAHLIHQGSYRVHARCIIAGTLQTQARLSWDVGDLTNSVVNPPFTFPSPGAGSTKGTAAYVADLGEVRLDPPAVGTHRWQGQIDAQTYNSTSGTVDFRIDKLWLRPLDEGTGVLTAPQVSATRPASLIGFDTLTYPTGTALCDKTAPLGGNWDPGAAGASTAEDGDTDDFIGAFSVCVGRNPAADSSLTNGRYAVLSGSSTLAAIEAQVDVSLPTSLSTASKEVRGGILARFVDTDNWLMAIRRFKNDSSTPFMSSSRISLIKKVGTTVTTLGDLLLPSISYAGWWTIKLTVDTAGNANVYTAAAGSDLGAAQITVLADANLKTGGALDDGKVGIYDASDLASAGARAYKDFKAYTPSATTIVSDAVTFASRSTQLTTDGMFRLDTGGTAYGPVSKVAGDLPRLPVAGNESRTTEVFLKNSRGDFDQLPDTWGTAVGATPDDLSARITYRPCYLNVGTI